MKFFHTADWHLGKLVQGVHMTDGQRHVLRQFLDAVKEERPDAVIIAGDLYDRAVPPTESVQLLDEVLHELIVELNTPVLAIAGNHDSPGRLHFGSGLMRQQGFYIAGKLDPDAQPVVLQDSFGEVHFHLVPYADPAVIRHIYEDETVTDFNSGMKAVLKRMELDPNARHVLIGHAFVTPHGEEADNTSESERPLSIGGAEYVSAELFSSFHYTALGHLHQAHNVCNETIRYAGSPMKYSISEEHHKKGFTIVEMGADGTVEIEKRPLFPKQDMRTVTGTIAELLKHEPSDDFVFVKLQDEVPVLMPMEKVRTVYPHAMHVERVILQAAAGLESSAVLKEKPGDLELFRMFYEEMKGEEADEETERIFAELLRDVLYKEEEGR